MTVSLVTGAGGFVGGHLCRHLEQQGAALRRLSSQAHEPSWRQVPLLDASDADVVAALEGAEQIYFLAGMAHEAAASGDPERLQQVNVEAPLRWLRAADRAGVRRFVWLSSIKVLGDSSARPLAPDDPYRPGDAYARSKTEAEQRLRDEPLSATSLAVVRPPLVYGPRARGNFAALLRLADSGVPLPLGGARAPRSLVAVDNLCDLLIRLGSGSGEGVFHVADDEDVTVSALVADMRRLLGRPGRQFAVSSAWMRGALRLLGRAGLHERLFEPLQVDITATRSRLRWSPPRARQEALADTVRWFQTSR